MKVVLVTIPDEVSDKTSDVLRLKSAIEFALLAEAVSKTLDLGEEEIEKMIAEVEERIRRRVKKMLMS